MLENIKTTHCSEHYFNRSTDKVVGLSGGNTAVGDVCQFFNITDAYRGHREISREQLIQQDLNEKIRYLLHARSSVRQWGDRFIDRIIDLADLSDAEENDLPLSLYSLQTILDLIDELKPTEYPTTSLTQNGCLYFRWGSVIDKSLVSLISKSEKDIEYAFITESGKQAKGSGSVAIADIFNDIPEEAWNPMYGDL